MQHAPTCPHIWDAPAAAKRVQPKGKLQKAAAKHQKAMGGRGAVAPGAGKPAAAPGTGQQPQAPQKLAASDLVIKAAVVGGLRLCLMMIMMERARKTDVSLSAHALQCGRTIGHISIMSEKSRFVSHAWHLAFSERSVCCTTATATISTGPAGSVLLLEVNQLDKARWCTWAFHKASALHELTYRQQGITGKLS